MSAWLSFIHTFKSSPHCVTKYTLALLFYSMVNNHKSCHNDDAHVGGLVLVDKAKF